MNERTQLVHNAIHAIHIYSGLQKKEIVRQVREARGTPAYPYSSFFMTAARWGDINYNVPTRYHEEICELGRRLTDTEEECLRLRNRGEFDVRIGNDRVYLTGSNAPQL